MRHIKRCLWAGGIFAAGLPVAVAQLEVGGSLLDNCADIDSLLQSDDFTQAREKAQLCLQGIDQELEGQVGAFFLEEVAGWTRTTFEQNAVMGFTNISADYTKDGTTANVALTRGSGGNSLGGLLGGLAQFGAQQAGQQVQVAGLRAVVMPDGTVLVTLDDGSFLSFSSPSFNDSEAALDGMGDLIDQFPVADINATLSDD